MKISVIIPTFNRAHLLPYAVESVLNQTYPNFEIIVVDDGSTDGTSEAIAQYGAKVRFFRQANAGVSVARNTGLDRATGDCVAFLDSDDYWYPFKLELQVRLLERLPAVSFTFSEFDILKDDGEVVHQGSRTWLADNTQLDDLYSTRFSSRSLQIDIAGVGREFAVYAGPTYCQFLDEPFVLPTTAMVRRSALGEVRFTAGMRIFEDWEFFAKLARSQQGAFADIETAVNRGHDDPNRVTRCSALTKAECYLDLLERVWKADAAFRSDYPDLVRRAESAATLALARNALLAGRRDLARQALERWRGVDGHVLTRQALACSILSRIPGGRHFLRASIVGQKLVRQAMSRSSHGSNHVNPAA